MADNLGHDFFKRLGIAAQNEDLRTGVMLIAEPFMADPNFSRSVILLCDYHSSRGAFGLVLNSPTEQKLNEVLPDFALPEWNFFAGGPVETDSLYYLHQQGAEVEGARKIMKDWWLGGDFSKLRQMIAIEKLEENQVRFFGGYAGWAVGQLEAEVSQKSWIVCRGNTNQLLAATDENGWRTVLKSLGKQYSIIADFPENPMLN